MINPNVSAAPATPASHPDPYGPPAMPAPAAPSAHHGARPAKGSLTFRFRGREVRLDRFAPRTTLLDWLRIDALATGTKEGCGEGDCGACTVVLATTRNGTVEHRPVNACVLLLGQVHGAEILTIEDLATDGRLHPIQQAMIDHHGSQCGFCTPGIVMSLFAIYQDAPRPVTRATVCDQLAGNLCRCTGYRPIIDAAIETCAGEASDNFVSAAPARVEALTSLARAGDLFVGDRDSFFAAPSSVEALAQLLLDHPDALILAGATDVGLWITKGFQDPRKIVWLGRVSGLDVTETRDGMLHIGAGTTIADAASALAAFGPDMAEVIRRFGSAQVRASGTVGGSIANGSPIGDLAPCFIALGARILLRRGSETRTLPLESFFLAYRKQDRQPSEFVLAIEIPLTQPEWSFRAYKVSKRPDEDISAVLGAFAFETNGAVVTDARVAFGGMAATPSRAKATEAALRGVDLREPATWEAALAALTNDFTPIDDMRASGAYRRRVAGNLLRKALIEAAGAPVARTRVLLPEFADA